VGKEKETERDTTQLIVEGLKDIIETVNNNKHDKEPRSDISNFLKLAPTNFNGTSMDPFQA
jgi:hypothetical protein